MQKASVFYQRVGQVLGGVVLLLGILATSASPAWSQATSLFFSEYVEGSGNNKALEIYNGTGAAVDLAAEGYKIEIYFNGNLVPLSVINLTGAIANGAVYVLADSGADAAILDVADQTSAVNFFNGDDAVALVRGTTLIDVIGQIGTDPGTAWGAGPTSTLNSTLRRRPTVCAGDPNGSDAFEPSDEWLGFAVDTFDGLGTHSAPCVDPGTLLAELAALKIRVGVLEGQVEALGNHTHTYLTGKGQGHNNTEATTGPPVILED